MQDSRMKECLLILLVRMAISLPLYFVLEYPYQIEEQKEAAQSIK